MNDGHTPLSGFNRPRPTQDPYVAEQYERLGIGPAPSLEDIEPHAIDMMRHGRLLEGMGLVLGRGVNAKDLELDEELMSLALVSLNNPEQAFGGLLLKRALDEQEDMLGVEEPETRTDEVRDGLIRSAPEFTDLIQARDAVVKAYCESNGISKDELTMDQVLEIRALPEWQNPFGQQ